MRVIFTIALAAACTLALAPTSVVEAQASRTKLQRAEKAKARPAVRRGTVLAARRSVATPGTGLQDRTTIYLPNGRLDGQALFDSIGERTSGAGE